MSRYSLNEDALRDALSELVDWRVIDGKLQKTFQFDSFAKAMGWMMSVAIWADKMDHHPEWFNVYNRVRVDLVTHDLDNTISNLDVELARKMDGLAG